MRPLWQYKNWPFLIGKDIGQAVFRRYSYGNEKRVCFVAGVQRSGTNMMMNVIERHPDTYVFKEGDSRAYDEFMMRAIFRIRMLVDETIPTFVIVKALHEAHDLYWMLDFFEGSKVLWMYRDYVDVINSNQRNFDNSRNFIDEIVEDPRRGFWRGLGMTDETLAIIREHYTDDLDNNSAQALFWYYRNQLFFDQNLDKDSRSLLIKYEPFVTNSAKYIDFISEFIGLEPKKDIIRKVHSSSIRKNISPDIRSDVATLCDGMRDRLDAVFEEKVERILA
jgi:hypothetical protein|tara:strand:+ start:134 stop:967 length:834 start_codon:yes stop_codon:yes gene_type:complete